MYQVLSLDFFLARDFLEQRSTLEDTAVEHCKRFATTLGGNTVKENYLITSQAFF